MPANNKDGDFAVQMFDHFDKQAEEYRLLDSSARQKNWAAVQEKIAGYQEGGSQASGVGQNIRRRGFPLKLTALVEPAIGIAAVIIICATFAFASHPPRLGTIIDRSVRIVSGSVENVVSEHTVTDFLEAFQSRAASGSALSSGIQEFRYSRRNRKL